MTCPWHDALQCWETVDIINVKWRNQFGVGFIFKGKFKLRNFFRQNVLLFVGKYSLWLNNQMPEEEHTYMFLIFHFYQSLKMGIFILKFGYFLFQMGLLLQFFKDKKDMESRWGLWKEVKQIKISLFLHIFHPKKELHCLNMSTKVKAPKYLNET